MNFEHMDSFYVFRRKPRVGKYTATFLKKSLNPRVIFFLFHIQQFSATATLLKTFIMDYFRNSFFYL